MFEDNSATAPQPFCTIINSAKLATLGTADLTERRLTYHMVTTRSETKAAAAAAAASEAQSALTTKEAAQPARKRQRRHQASDTSHHLSPATNAIPSLAPLPPRLLQRPRSLTTFGLIQEHVQHNLYFLLVQSILWNQTHGRAARPVLSALLARYPDPDALSWSYVADLAQLLRPIGLQNIRAARLIALAQAWIAAPPSKERRYRRLHYPRKGCGVDVKAGEVLDERDAREGWEIAHLPGVGVYALDSYRIFCRDRLRGVVCSDGNEKLVQPEWKRVVPTDKDLRAYLVWKWNLEGWIWDPLTGNKKRIEESVNAETIARE